MVCAAFIGLFSIFSFRLIYLQAIKHDEYAGLAAVKFSHTTFLWKQSWPTPRILAMCKQPLVS